LGLQYSNNSSIVHEQHSCFREGAIAKLEKEYVLKIISGPVPPTISHAIQPKDFHKC